MFLINVENKGTKNVTLSNAEVHLQKQIQIELIVKEVKKVEKNKTQINNLQYENVYTALTTVIFTSFSIEKYLIWYTRHSWI